jgi:hypothetical protein
MPVVPADLPAASRVMSSISLGVAEVVLVDPLVSSLGRRSHPAASASEIAAAIGSIVWYVIAVLLSSARRSTTRANPSLSSRADR